DLVVGCRLAFQMETKNLPDSKAIQCYGEGRVLLGQHSDKKIYFSFSPDNWIRISVGKESYVNCGPFHDQFPAQQQVDLYLGSHFYNLRAPEAVRITSVHYGLVGPRGTIGVHDADNNNNDDSEPIPGPGTIPRIIHQVWLGTGEPSTLIDSWRAHALFAQGAGGWEHRLWNSEEAVAAAVFGGSDDLLKQLRPFYQAEESNAGKSDFLRFALLYVFGGVYVDADSLWLGPTSSLESIISDAKFVAAWEGKRNLLVATGIMASVPRGDVVRRVLEYQVQLFQHCRGDLERRPWDPLALGTLTQVLTSAQFARETLLLASCPTRHDSKARGAVSLDLGMGTNKSTNKFPPGSFAAGTVPRPAGSRGVQLIEAWKGAVASFSELLARETLGGLGNAVSELGFAGNAPGSRVAHADDEILFGGSLLSEGPPWLVVVATAPVAPADQKQREEISPGDVSDLARGRFRSRPGTFQISPGDVSDLARGRFRSRPGTFQISPGDVSDFARGRFRFRPGTFQISPGDVSDLAWGRFRSRPGTFQISPGEISDLALGDIRYSNLWKIMSFGHRQAASPERRRYQLARLPQSEKMMKMHERHHGLLPQ
ncbi:unnamed protein product, partial [Polarella glacialis]